MTVSPVRNEIGEIIGASKIARDITSQKRASAQQSVLLREMHHRIKNLFTVVGALISLSAKAATSSSELAADLKSRMQALSRAHSLALPDLSDGEIAETGTTVVALLKAILAPHEDHIGSRIAITGEDAPLSGPVLTSVALLLHEFATNAAKYGVLSSSDGKLAIHLEVKDGKLHMLWVETNEISPEHPTQERSIQEGFGSTLERAAVQGIGGTLSREWRPTGLSILLDIPFDRLVG